MLCGEYFRFIFIYIFLIFLIFPIFIFSKHFSQFSYKYETNFNFLENTENEI